MRFRPCIDIHGGRVKQIVGSSLDDAAGTAEENFVSEQDASYYADKYRRDGLAGGHIILLDRPGTEAHELDRRQAAGALGAFPGGMQIGGGVTVENAAEYIEAGASHVIVTSYVFRDGKILWDNIRALEETVGREHIVLDLSCRRRDDEYYIVTDRWQKFTETIINEDTLNGLAEHCDEFLIHAVDVEGKSAGIDVELASLLGGWDGIPVTYAGGIRNTSDLDLLRDRGRGRLDATIGSALDIFGGKLPYEDVIAYFEAEKNKSI